MRTFIARDIVSGILICESDGTFGDSDICVKLNSNVTSNLIVFKMMELLNIQDLIPSHEFISNFNIIVNGVTHHISSNAIILRYYPNTTSPPSALDYGKNMKFGFNFIDMIDGDVLTKINRLLIMDFVIYNLDRNDRSFLFSHDGNKYNKCKVIDNEGAFGINMNRNIKFSEYDSDHIDFLTIFTKFSAFNLFYLNITSKYNDQQHKYDILTEWLYSINIIDNMTVDDFHDTLHHDYSDPDTVRLFETYMQHDKPKIIKSFRDEYEYVKRSIGNK